MALRNRAHNISRFVATGLLALAGGLFAGCGSGVANMLPGASQPQAGVPAGPTLGYVFSPVDGTLRALLGVRGSSQVSTSIVPAGVYVAGDASTAGSTALLEDGSGSLFAFNLPLSQPIHVADGLPAHVQIAFSASGKTAIAYSPGSSTLTLITGLPASPAVQTRTVSAAGSLISAAVSDTGTVVLAVSGTPASVGTLSPSGQFSALTRVAALGGLNFIPGSDDLLIADGGAGTAMVLRNVSSGASSQPLTVAGLNQPVAIAGSPDKHWAVIANGADASVFRVDLTSNAAAVKLTCACQPTQLSSLAGGTFRLNSLYGGPLWTVDVASTTPQLLFVPAISK